MTCYWQKLQQSSFFKNTIVWLYTHMTLFTDYKDRFVWEMGFIHLWFKETNEYYAAYGPYTCLFVNIYWVNNLNINISILTETFWTESEKKELMICKDVEFFSLYPIHLKKKKKELREGKLLQVQTVRNWMNTWIISFHWHHVPSSNGKLLYCIINVFLSLVFPLAVLNVLPVLLMSILYTFSSCTSLSHIFSSESLCACSTTFEYDMAPTLPHPFPLFQCILCIIHLTVSLVLVSRPFDAFIMWHI